MLTKQATPNAYSAFRERQNHRFNNSSLNPACNIHHTNTKTQDPVLGKLKDHR